MFSSIPATVLFCSDLVQSYVCKLPDSEQAKSDYVSGGLDGVVSCFDSAGWWML